MRITWNALPGYPPGTIAVFFSKSQWQIPLEGSSRVWIPWVPTGPVPRSMRGYWGQDPKARALRGEEPWLMRLTMVRASIKNAGRTTESIHKTTVINPRFQSCL